MSDSVYLSVGSNMGNALENCRESLRRLNSVDGIFVKKVSQVLMFSIPQERYLYHIVVNFH